MSGHMWKQDNEGGLHPDDSFLLAYTRGQLSIADTRQVNEHLTRCYTCQVKCAQYKYNGDGLQNALAYPIPAYPSIVAMLGERIESPAAAQQALRERRQKRLREDVALAKALAIFALKKALGIHTRQGSRPRNRAMASVPVVGIPVLLILVLTAVIAVLAFTMNNYINTRSGQPSVHNSRMVSPTQTVILPRATSTPTPTSAPTRPPTAGGHTPGTGSVGGETPSGTPSPTGNASPMVYVCSSAGDLKQSNLVICGKNFKPGDKVVLYEYVPGIGYRPKPPVIIANAQGSISAVWTITNCRTMPASVYAIDLRDNAQTALVPVNVTVGNCLPNARPRPPGKN